MLELIDDKMTSKADISKASGIQKSWHLQKSGVLNNSSHIHTKPRSIQHHRSSEHPKPVSLVTKKGSRWQQLRSVPRLESTSSLSDDMVHSIILCLGPAPPPAREIQVYWTALGAHSGHRSGYKSRSGSHPHSVETNEQSKQQIQRALELQLYTYNHTNIET